MLRHGLPRQPVRPVRATAGPATGGLGEQCAQLHPHQPELTAIDPGGPGQCVQPEPRQLSRRFKAKFGTTIGRWNREARMQNARMLLETTENTVTDIAYTIGFPSLQAFTRFFHAYEGCSPSEFRARRRSQ